MYTELVKLRLSLLVVATTAIGFVLASVGGFDWLLFVWTLAGTACSAFGINAVNQCIEIDRDARMERTRMRPLPARRLALGAGWGIGLALSVVGPLVLWLAVNWLTAVLALVCQLIYVLIYTPMKVRSPLNTLVGAVCGAIPPMMGWTAAVGTLEIGAWVLGVILFIWQVPHFLALAWMYRDDYARGGFQMLPAGDRDGAATCQAVMLFSLALLPVTLMLSVVGVTGWIYAIGAIGLGGVLVLLSWRLDQVRDVAAARRVFLASVIYLPLLLLLMLADRVSTAGSLVWTPVDVATVVGDAAQQAQGILP